MKPSSSIQIHRYFTETTSWKINSNLSSIFHKKRTA